MLEVFSQYKANLGEGPIYDIELDKLLWVDIEGKKIIINDLKEGCETFLSVPDLVSSLCVIDERKIIATIRHGFYVIDLTSKFITKVAEAETNLENNRFNDGKCDKLGRYWAGTMNMLRNSPNANLYKLEGNYLAKMLEGLTVSNGLGWSPDNDKMYLIDTPTRKVFVFDFDLSKGEIYNREVLIDFGDEPGRPDGMTVDEEGYLWIAHSQGGKVSRWSPKGKKVFEIKLPVRFVTSVTFGTREMNTLFITTGSQEGEPLSGRMFKYKTDVKGLPAYRFKWAGKIKKDAKGPFV